MTTRRTTTGWRDDNGKLLHTDPAFDQVQGTCSGSFGPAAEMAARARDEQATFEQARTQTLANNAAEARQFEIDRMQRELELRGTVGGEYGDPVTPYIPWKVPVLSPLPTDSAARKHIPLWDGCLDYFPAALAAVAATSYRGNIKHNPGEELHHARGKSMDHRDCIARHLVDYQAFKAAGCVPAAQLQEELGNLAWRTLAFVQQELEGLGLAPLAPGARVAK